MTPERWKQIEKLYNAALEHGRAVLADADPELRGEVESLLAKSGTLPALEDVTQTLVSTKVSAGTQLGPYKIDSLLGAGGMGEVFRAVDTRLGRGVALKTCEVQFTQRFQREARAISALNHPHICTLYDVGPSYLVMELIEGETLAERLKRGALPVETVFEYGLQIAEALAAAHAKGITHRDLKPGNIMIAPMGVNKTGIKVLDFGLAKTSDETLTQTNAVMGTPAYMAPEQRQGQPADARSDIFSFGLVLYEMATGKRVPQMQPVQFDALPRGLARIVEKCVKENPDERWQTAASVITALEQGAKPVPAGVFNHPKTMALIAALALVLLAASYFYLRAKPKLTDKDTIVLADFVNKTGDAVFDGTLRQGLAIQLEQSPFLSLLSDERIQGTLGLMGQPADAGLPPKIAKEICERTGSSAVLEGSIEPIGTAYALGLRAKNCHTGDVLDEEQVQAPRKEDVLNALSQIASKFRTRVGESLATVAQHNIPLEEATTPSIEALKEFSAGWKLHITVGSAPSVPLFKRAIDLDHNFAMAYAFLGRSYGDMGETGLSAENTRIAYRLRDHTSEREKFFITATYEQQVTGNLQKAGEIFEAWAREYPRELPPHGLLSGQIYPTFGKFEKAIEEAKKAIEIDPNFVFGYPDMATAYQFLNRLDEAEATVQTAFQRKLEEPDLLLQWYDLEFLRGDKAEMERAAALCKGKPGAEDMIHYQEALVLAYSGHLQQAREKTQLAVSLDQQPGQADRAAIFETGAALSEAFFGNMPAAKRNAVAALKISKDRDVEYGSAFALGLAGENSESQRLADDLAKRFQEDTSVQTSYLPVLRALLALKRGEASKAVEFLRAAGPNELGVPQSWFSGSFGALYSVYLRGEAYRAMGRGAEAAAEFQKVIDNRGIVQADPIGALAHLQLGRALALPGGDKTKAKAAYQDFLNLWNQPDGDIPIFDQARKENARL